MAVVVEFRIPGATHEDIYAVEELTRARGEAAGGPPYPGCMFLATLADDGGMRVVSTWRTEADFRLVLDVMLAPDLATRGRSVGEATVTEVVSMAIPGAHAP